MTDLPLETILKAMTPCMELTDLSHCAESCPLYHHGCSGDMPAFDFLADLVRRLPLPPDQKDQKEIVLEGLARCGGACNTFDEDQCNEDCPYWEGCYGEDFTDLIEDFKALANESGLVHYQEERDVC